MLTLRIRDLCGVRVRYGYRRITALQREGWKVNAKRIRIYKAQGLEVRTKARKKRAAQARVPLPVQQQLQAWSMDLWLISYT